MEASHIPASCYASLQRNATLWRGLLRLCMSGLCSVGDHRPVPTPTPPGCCRREWDEAAVRSVGRKTTSLTSLVDLVATAAELGVEDSDVMPFLRYGLSNMFAGLLRPLLRCDQLGQGRRHITSTSTPFGPLSPLLLAGELCLLSFISLAAGPGWTRPRPGTCVLRSCSTASQVWRVCFHPAHLSPSPIHNC